MTFWPISADHCTGITDGVMHAIGTMAAIKGDRTAVCGAELEAPAAADTNLDSNLVLPWPPYQRDSDLHRCRACWTATGKPRPDGIWQRARQETTRA